MRKQQQGAQPLLLLSIPSTLIISLSVLFPALLLNAELALPQGTGPAALPSQCFASTNHSSSCSSSKVNVSFPFFTSDDQCHDRKSSFVILKCQPSNTYLNWPDFTKDATKDSPLLSTTVVNMYSPLPTEPPYTDNSSSSGLPFNPGYGYITLTWNPNLLSQNVCGTLAPNEQISQSIPQSINLQDFANSTFNFDSSNIILLFRCNATKAVSSSNLHMSSNACIAYENECMVNKDESYNCYQYMIPNLSKELNLSQVMNALGCKQSMFFVPLNPSLVYLTWKPGLILLNWDSTGTDWLASTFQDCAKCLSISGGSCGYDSVGNFTCSCGTNCSSENTKPPSSSPRTTPSSRPLVAPLIQGSRPLGAPPMQDDSSHKSNKNLSVVILVAGFSSMALFISLALLALFFFCKRKPGGKDFSSELNVSWIKRPSFLSRKQDATLAREISFKELVCATETFADKNILGDGGFGAVYRGVLPGGLKVAVKRLHHDNYRRMEHFYNEIKVLSNLNHPNLVKLFGFCACEDKRELLLVFEYASQGTVSDHLHGGQKPPMSWSLRLNIACETADALSYLHNAVVPPIYHRDVKTANILLDDGFHVKLADFGLSKLVPMQVTHISTSPQGTPGYLDPEYHECYQLTDKSDVYSLGVVLMELVSGMLAVDMSRERGEINLSTLAVMKIQCGLLEELVDPQLDMKKEEKSIKRVVELAFACLQGYRDDRPSMRFVAETLACIRREHEGASIATQKQSPSSPLFSSCDSSSASSALSSYLAL